MQRIFSIFTLLGSAAMAVAACGASENDAIASFKHDYGKARTLYAYKPEPAAETRQADLAANRTYGFETKSPRTPYLCAWRDTGRRSAKASDVPPDEVFLTCAFGTSFWTPPSRLVDEAEHRGKRDEAILRAQWTRSDGIYRMSRFELEIKDAASHKSFRSINFGPDVADIDFSQAAITFPASGNDMMAFNISASVPERSNRGDDRGKQASTISLSGTAGIIPSWLLY